MSLLNTLFAGHKDGIPPEFSEAVAWAVDRVDPLLKQAGGYPDLYLESVAHAVKYAHVLAARVPGPVSISPESYARDPSVHAMFPFQTDLHLAMQRSQSMQEFFRNHPDVSAVYVLACMRRQSKPLFGMEVEGEILRRDVRQDAVYFVDYTLAAPGLSEAETRQCIARFFFECLIGKVANRIDARKQRKADLEQERDALLAQLRSASAEQWSACAQRLNLLLGRLADLVRTLELCHYHKHFERVLLSAENHLFLEQTEMSLDSMGIVRKPAAMDGNEMAFCDLIGRDSHRWTVAMLYCNQVRSRATTKERLENAQRWMGL